MNILRLIISALALVSATAAIARTFDELHVSGPCELHLVESADSCGLVEAGGDFSGVDFRYVGSAVFVDVNAYATVRGRKSIVLYYDGHLRLIRASGRSVVMADNIKSTDQLTLVASGAASISIGRLSAANVNVSLTGSGKIDVGGELLASTLNFSLIGSGSVKASSITASRMTVTQRGSGKMIFGGSARDCDVVGRGTGTVDLRGLVAGEMDLKLLGDGHIYYPAGVRVSIGGNTQNIIQVKPYQPL